MDQPAYLPLGSLAADVQCVPHSLAVHVFGEGGVVHAGHGAAASDGLFGVPPSGSVAPSSLHLVEVVGAHGSGVVLEQSPLQHEAWGESSLHHAQFLAVGRRAGVAGPVQVVGVQATVPEELEDVLHLQQQIAFNIQSWCMEEVTAPLLRSDQ